jgi:hypothetical protein
MTLHATREGQVITVHGNTGTEILVQNSNLVHARIREDARHVEGFHAQLGALLADAKTERGEA